MPAYPFSDAQIESILIYLEVEGSKPIESPDATAAGDAAGGQGPTSTELPVSLMIIIALFIVSLTVTLMVMSRMASLFKMFVQKGPESLLIDVEGVTPTGVGLQEEPTRKKASIFKSNYFLGIAAFIFFASILKAGIDGLFTVGVQQGYQPTQPIAFSHGVHVGEYEIDCQYCHTGVRKGRSANIPSANICMNCHTSILPESREIKKIYASLDYDPEEGTYGPNPSPIEWVRVHNLPDLAYFNHSQHVEVGGS